MGNKKKRDRDSYGSESEKLNKNKNVKTRGPSEETNIAVSELLCETISILFGANRFHLLDSDVFVDSSESSETDVRPLDQNMEAQGRPEMSNTSNTSIEILEFLKRIDGRLVNVEKRLDSLMGLEKKVDNFDMELKKLRTAFEDRNRK
ncbi:hypothetical protein DPMN_100534 [Dreissena polymorpha]|uniref:Uncharacterized protein n=1 Tax=Dreissena polymorpha TaxID=45954 RepID=A0A9D4LH82_DREPO|nr:hypothetical protein DPMN_100534 [Dreissena polymorpha]